MNITIIGTGYVGLVTGTCFAEMGHRVICVDTDKDKVFKLNDGVIPIYEPGLKKMVSNNLSAGRLSFVNSLPEAAKNSGLFMIAVGTPPGPDGNADLQFVLTVARELGRNISGNCLVVNKSTVPVGTADTVRRVIEDELKQRNAAYQFDVISNPEFLKEGVAIDDFMKPDRIIVGAENQNSINIMRELYADFSRSHDRLVVMGIKDAEMTKYVANAMLATKISFMNEIANICDRLKVDVESVRVGIGSDSRIGYHFIYPGAGYGGSCFPKDVQALIGMSRENNFQPTLLQAVESRNTAQKSYLYEKITNHFSADMKGKNIALWGLAFKPGTDDLREAPSRTVLEELIEAGAKVKAYDPVAMDAAQRQFPKQWFDSGQLELVNHQYDAVEGADAMVLITEWKPFRHPDFAVMLRLMKQPVIFDGRNQYRPEQLTGEGFIYYGVGR